MSPPSGISGVGIASGPGFEYAGRMRFSMRWIISLPAAFLVTVLGSCGGGSESAVQPGSLMCNAAAGLSLASDAAAPGCKADPAFQSCSTSGCKSACAGSELPVACTGDSSGGTIPEPDAAFSCTVIPIPTPSNELFYCCPCAN